MRLFDAYVMADWSANSVPKRGRDSIWVCFGRWQGWRLEISSPENLPTRSAATDRVKSLLVENARAGSRTLVGFDFPYGYPTGFAAALGNSALQSQPMWRSTWDAISLAIRDDERNRNDRYSVAADFNTRCGNPPGPFWGCPSTKAGGALSTRSPTFPFFARGGVELPRYRHTEMALRRGGKQVQETWKLCYAGSVGSQALVGIPRVAALRDDPEIAGASAVWPFETGFTSDPVLGRK